MHSGEGKEGKRERMELSFSAVLDLAFYKQLYPPAQSQREGGAKDAPLSPRR